VTRIIAGAVGSLRLKGPAKATRPTSDRVKESVFAKLEAMGVIEGARVLDLYAGTGALGLEAASRGAVSVFLVEKDRAAAEVCKSNLEVVTTALSKQGLSPKISLQILSVEKFLKTSHAASLVFIDPPYDLENAALESILAALVGASAEMLVVLERSSKSELPVLPAQLKELDLKSYGDTKVWFLAKRLA
jgi:16S rRNA (guanine966-N2)-methyltransferase